MPSSRRRHAVITFASVACSAAVACEPQILPGSDGGEGGAFVSGAGGALEGTGAGNVSSTGSGSISSGAAVGSGGAAPFACDVGEPATVLAAIEWPVAMVQDAGSLYVASYAETGGVYRVAKDGSGSVKLADFNQPLSLAIADGWLYVAASGDHELVRLPLAGGTSEHLADFGSPTDVKVAGGWAFVANHDDNTLERVPIAGGEPKILAHEQRGIYKLALLDGWVAWASTEPGLNALPQAGGDVVRLSDHGARALAVWGTSIYSTSNEPSVGIHRTDLDGTDEVVVTSARGAVEGVAVDEDYLYWGRYTDDGTDGVRRVPRTGGEEAVLDVVQPIEIVLDGTCIYVTSGVTLPGDGVVQRLGVPASPAP